MQVFKGITFHNVDQLVPFEGGGWTLSRVPAHVREELNEAARVDRAVNTCGVELRFIMRSERATFTLRRDEARPNSSHAAEIYYGQFQAPYTVTPRMIGTEPTTITIERPDTKKLSSLHRERGFIFDPDVIRIVLPYDWKIIFIDAEGDLVPPKPEQLPKRRYLAYGSSITHGGDAVRPTGSYAMRIADLLGVDLLNKGFAGSAYMDPALGLHIAERDDWDFASLEMGINVIGLWTAEVFESRMRDFLAAILGGKRNRLLFVTDLFLCNRDLDGLDRIVAYRKAVRRAVEDLGDSRTVYTPGTELLRSVTELSADLVHPSAAGQEAIALRWSDLMRRRMEAE
ncbi:GDSL-type esterase/lipase family protein [Paenibacillus puerhi]|uniref:GDSL-type esterase/lipase family protein n=1 Tax=Paenibacillus puerhi TaxID=2692622 RepID=UPI00135A9152|nr:GDSL-type esterase/lipase family protein [Paenibacillus puerhi]